MVLESVLQIGREYKQRIHVCHISTEKELRMVQNAKLSGQTVTCGVTAHHLFLCENDIQKLGPYSTVKPYLKNQKDVSYLWEHFGDIDIIESDHAPHLKA
jgi:dihydroorotase-like cyclic amidohydrolase